MDRRRPGDLTRGPLATHVLRFGWPLALGMAGHGVFNLVDLVIVGRLHTGAIAAVTIAGIVLTVAMLIFEGISNATVTVASQAHGAGNRRMLHQIAWESLIVAIGGGVIGGVIFWALSWPMVRFFGLGRASTIDEAVDYLQIMALGLVTMFLIMHTTSVLRAVGNAFWPAVILVGANALNILLDIALVFGYWGFPRLGVAGAAWATVIARLAGAGLGFWLIWRGTGGVALRRIPFRRPFQFLRTMFVTGVPTSLQLSARVVAVFFLLGVARDAWPGSGSEMLDGVGICIRLEMVAVFMALGWGAAATTLVGQNLGAGLPGRAAWGSWVLTFAGAASMTVVGILVWTFREPLFRLIMPELSAGGFRAGEGYLAVTIPFYPAIAVGLVLARGLNGAGCTKTPLVIDAVGGFLVMLPLGAWLAGAGIFGLLVGRPPDVHGAWWGMGIANSLGALAYILVFRGGRWRTKASLVAPPARGASTRARLTVPRSPE